MTRATETDGGCGVVGPGNGAAAGSARATGPADPRGGLARGHVLLLGLIAGLSVAGLYYAQPLLDTISVDFGVSTGRASLLITASQVGYVVGVGTVVPLGDKLDRRRLLVTLLAASAVVLGLTAVTPDFWLLWLGMLAVGVTAAAAMVAVPFGAALAAPTERTRVTGSVMSGLLLGILLARTAAGAVAQVASWRVVFAAAAVLALALAVLTRTRLPVDDQAKDARPYGRILVSIVPVIRAEPALRSRMVLGFLAMFSFSALWTSIAFLLARHYGLGEAAIGLFGLVGAAGAFAAPLAGRVADGGRSVLATSSGWVLMALGWLLMLWGATSMGALIAGLLVFDFAAQTCQITNQGRIYQLAAELRSRITTAYIVTFFLGGVAGSLASGYVYADSGWAGVCVCGLVATAVGGGFWAWSARRGL